MTTIQQFNQTTTKGVKKYRDLKPGYTVRVHQLIVEGKKERIQVFEGIIIKKKGTDPINCTITVRKISDGIGVERIFPLLSPVIKKIEVVKKAKVRRAKLYYMRGLSGKAARLKEQRVSKKEQELHEELNKEEEAIVEQKEEKTNLESKATENEAKQSNNKEVDAVKKTETSAEANDNVKKVETPKEGEQKVDSKEKTAKDDQKVVNEDKKNEASKEKQEKVEKDNSIEKDQTKE